MKAMYKSELARLAGVSSRTFARYLAAHREELAKLGVSSHIFSHRNHGNHRKCLRHGLRISIGISIGIASDTASEA